MIKKFVSLYLLLGIIGILNATPPSVYRLYEIKTRAPGSLKVNNIFSFMEDIYTKAKFFLLLSFN